MILNSHTIRAFRDEMQKIAALDPMTAAGMVAGGKIMATNILSRHAPSIAPMRRIGQEIAGVGARTAMQGKPMLSRPFREAASAVVDPKLVGLYENAHGAATALGTHANPQAIRGIAEHIRQMPAAQNMPSVMRGADFASKIPLEHGPGVLGAVRKTVDYGFTPVSQVGRDIGGLAQRGAQAVSGGVQRTATRVGNMFRRPVPAPTPVQ